MKVKDVIKELQKTGLNNEVRLINDDPDDKFKDFIEDICFSFDDIGDVLLYPEHK